MPITVTSEPVKVTVSPKVAKVTVSGNPSKVVLSTTGVPGPPGPPGPPGAPGSGYQHDQNTPSSSWSIPHDLDRRPVVSVYVDDEEVEADIVADTTAVSVTFPYPVSGYAVLV